MTTLFGRNWHYILCLCVLIVGSSPLLQAQDDKLTETLEDYSSNLDEDSDFENNDILDQLEQLAAKPADLNQIDQRTLSGLFFLDELAVHSILDYRAKQGPFISVLELQAVPNVTLEQARLLSQYVQVGADFEGFYLKPKDIFRSANHMIISHYSGSTPLKAGYRATEDKPAVYKGEPHRWYARYRASFGRRYSFGVTVEKDAGEPNWADFVSAHFFMNNPENRIKTIAIGDYQLNIGQGLSVYQGFSTNKSAWTTNINRGGYVIRPHASTNEIVYLRGGATTIDLLPRNHTNKDIDFDLTLFGSYRATDANQVLPDSLDEFYQEYISSIQTSGLHRTQNEIDDKNALKITTLGGYAVYQQPTFKLGGYFLAEKLSHSLNRSDQLYQKYRFEGDALNNLGIDYQVNWNNGFLFGEVARSNNDAYSVLIGTINSFSAAFRTSVLYRNYNKSFHSLRAQPFGETTTGTNEEGLFFGVEYQLSKEWQINAYADMFYHPWLRFTAAAPSRGLEGLFRLTYTKKRNLSIYGQVRHEQKQRNIPGSETVVTPLGWQTRRQVRIHFSKQFKHLLQLRSRIEWSFYDLAKDREHGLLLYQDFIVKPQGQPFSFTARLAYFNTDGYNSRIYTYENDVKYRFFIPALYNQGFRTYLTTRVKMRSWTFEGRVAWLEWTNGELIGSGNEATNAPHRLDWTLQAQYQF